jgi:hypothetical protein
MKALRIAVWILPLHAFGACGLKRRFGCLSQPCEGLATANTSGSPSVGCQERDKRDRELC